MKINGGKVLFLDRSDISMEEILSADYVNDQNKQSLKTRLFEKIELEGVDIPNELLGKKVIITRSNFGCSASESQLNQIPCVLEKNGFTIVAAQSFSSSFRSILFNCGMAAAELDKKSIEDIFRTFSQKDTECTIIINEDLSAKLKIVSGSLSKSYQFSLSENEKNQILNKTWKGALS